jgi:hypothetical protein
MRYYFGLYGNLGGFIYDPVGIELADDEAARLHALSLGRKPVVSSRFRDWKWTIVVHDQNDRHCVNLPGYEREQWSASPSQAGPAPDRRGQLE